LTSLSGSFGEASIAAGIEPLHACL